MTKTERAIIKAAYAWHNTWENWSGDEIKTCLCAVCVLNRAVLADKRSKRKGGKA